MASKAARIDACGCFSWRISGVWRYIVSASTVSVTAVFRLAINFSVKLQSGAYVLDGIYNTWHLHAPYCLLSSVSIHFHYIPFTDHFSCSFNEWHVSKTRSIALKMLDLLASILSGINCGCQEREICNINIFSQYSMQLCTQVKAKQNTFVSIVLPTGLLEYFGDLFQHLGALFQQDCPDQLPPTIAPQCYTNDFFLLP